jgi:hypothetical protein
VVPLLSGQHDEELTKDEDDQVDAQGVTDLDESSQSHSAV